MKVKMREHDNENKNQRTYVFVLIFSPKVFPKFAGFPSKCCLCRPSLGCHYQSGFPPASYTILTSLISYDLSNTYSNPIAFTRVLQV